ncbi:MAG: sensor histidine kinase, partial [Chitinophagaceae bacterium]
RQVFMSMASHELKTPLSSLKGYVQLIGRQTSLPNPVSLYVSKANESINKLQHLINNLLDVSKIRAGKLKFETQVFDLADLLKNCAEDVKHMYKTFNIEVQSDNHLYVKGNPERLEQVLMNLVSNAVKYSPDNKEIIICGTRKENQVIVSVTDFGIGLADENQSKIFDRFYRVETDKFSQGLGIGLYISSEIIKEHHGVFEVKSKVNDGSTFSFSLPWKNPSEQVPLSN